jgi:hypothetical protein
VSQKRAFLLVTALRERTIFGKVAADLRPPFWQGGPDFCALLQPASEAWGPSQEFEEVQ